MKTHPSLLWQLRDVADAPAWERFVELYTPLVFRFVRKRGLQEADAADVAQDVMKSVAGAIRQFDYEPARGGFRNWLFTVTRSKLSDFFEQQRRAPAALGGTEMMRYIQEQPGDIGQTEWDREYRLRMFHWAAERVRTEFKTPTWEAFWRTAVNGQPVGTVANDLGLSEGAVYIARSRVIARLRQQVRSVTGDWEEFTLSAA